MSTPRRREQNGALEWTFPDERPVKTLATLGLAWALLTPFGPGVVALGTGQFTVACEAAQQCRLEEGYLFGALPLRAELGELREAALVDVGDSGSTLVEFATASGAVRASNWMTSLPRGDQRSLVRQVNVAVRGGGPFVVRQSMYSPLALFGGLMAVLWLFVTWGLLWLPVAWRWPQAVRFERDARQLVIRTAGGALRRRRVTLAELREVVTTRNPGGPFGDFIGRAVPPPTTGPEDEERKTPPLNVCLVLSGERRLVLRNEHQRSDDDVRAFAADLAASVGLAVREGAPG